MTASSRLRITLWLFAVTPTILPRRTSSQIMRAPVSVKTLIRQRQITRIEAFDLKPEHLIDQVCIQEILPPDKD